MSVQVCSSCSLSHPTKPNSLPVLVLTHRQLITLPKLTQNGTISSITNMWIPLIYIASIGSQMSFSHCLKNVLSKYIYIYTLIFMYMYLLYTVYFRSPVNLYKVKCILNLFHIAFVTVSACQSCEPFRMVFNLSWPNFNVSLTKPCLKVFKNFRKAWSLIIKILNCYFKFYNITVFITYLIKATIFWGTYCNKRLRHKGFPIFSCCFLSVSLLPV